MGKIEVKNLSFSYDEKNVFKDFFASFPAGEISVIMAPSGKGKTTLLYLIAGILKADAGDIEYPKSGKKISFVFQDDRLINNLSVCKNIKLVNEKLTEYEIKQCLQNLGIGDKYSRKVMSLSGGERQRVSIARALLAEYDILLLDEPFEGVDENNKDKAIKYIKENTCGKTIILVTHNKYEADNLGGKIYFI